MKTSLFDFDYPPELVAQEPLAARDASRLMVIAAEKPFEHSRFSRLPHFLSPGDCLVLNETKVIPARLLGAKPSGGAVEMLLLRKLTGDTWEVMAKPARRLKSGAVILFGDGRLRAEVTSESAGGLRRVSLTAASGTVDKAIDELGQMPLPPYIHNDKVDPRRYQTIYAAKGTSAAAPTAGLHFTNSLLDEIEKAGVSIARVNLDVGLGTFRPIECDEIEDHVMHSERFEVGVECARLVSETRESGGRVIAVGTTSARVLESAATSGGIIQTCAGETDIYIKPGYGFKVVDAMVTNFHLPRSSLLVMVSAFAGMDVVRRAYAAAVAERYRLFSFGDAMFVVRRNRSYRSHTTHATYAIPPFSKSSRL